jgi:amino acid permease
MNKILVTVILVVGIFILFFGGLFLYFTNIDFVGHKDPKTVKKNVQAINKTLLTARYFTATEVCEITLSDSTNIRINVGTNEAYSMIFRKYNISGDTIIIKVENENKYENQELEKYINSNKMLVKNNEILFQTDDKKQFIPTKTMKIELNNLAFKN